MRVGKKLRQLITFISAINFMIAGALIAKAFDYALAGHIWTAIVAAALSGINITAGRYFIDQIKEDETGE